MVALTVAAGCGKWADDLVCGDQGCSFTRDEWVTVQSLAHITKTPPLPDPSNKYLPIANWRTRALASDATADGDGTLAAQPWADIPEVQLGWRLYFEPRLSGSPSNVDSMGLPAATTRIISCGQVYLSCATCHDPRRYGADFTSVPNVLSIGTGWEDTNSQQTLNVARFPVFAWNGETDALWGEAAEVIEDPLSMNGHRAKTFWVIVKRYWTAYAAIFADAGATAAHDLAARLPAPADTAPTSAYADQYAALGPADQQTMTRVHVNAAKAIAAYEWLLTSDGSSFDRFVSEGATSRALSPAAQRGLKLFIGRASCIDCHNTPLFSDGRYHNIGVPQSGDHVPTESGCATPQCNCTDGGRDPSCSPWGAYAAIEGLPDEEFRRHTIYDDNFVANTDPATVDAGSSQRIEPSDTLIGAWRTPSLRDVAMTAPYMHDGVFATLSDVIWHYDQGGGQSAIGTSELSPLFLSAQDRDDLVAFLQSLTGTAGPADLLDPPDGSAPPAADAGCASNSDGGVGAGP
jgi:cytochrome c peroxidase